MNSIPAVIEALRRAPEIVVPLVREVPPSILKRRPAPRRWSAHEHACHLAHVHALFFDRLDYMLRDPAPVIEPYFPGDQDADDLLLRMDLDRSLERFVSDRARLVACLEALGPSDWSRTARHGEYRTYSVFIMFRHLALHDFLHAHRIEELLLRADWADATAERIRRPYPSEHAALLELWERSVRATHHFLAEADIAFYRPLVGAMLSGDVLELWILASGTDDPIGFMGLAGGSIEALFLAPDRRREGGGRRLVEHAQSLRGGELTADVNEQNVAALGFYQALGFTVVGRSPVDATGRPYPILHLHRRAPDHATAS